MSISLSPKQATSMADESESATANIDKRSTLPLQLSNLLSNYCEIKIQLIIQDVTCRISTDREEGNPVLNLERAMGPLILFSIKWRIATARVGHL